MMETNPFESPKASVSQARSAAKSSWADDAPPFRSAHGRALLTLGLLLITGLLELAHVGASLSQIRLLQRIQAGEEVSEETANRNDQTALLAAVGAFGARLATGVAFLVWIYRAYQNLPSLGAKDFYSSPGGAVGWWFCPFANLYKPYKVVREIWLVSDPYATTDDVPAIVQGGGAPLVGWWWAFWIIDIVLAQVATRIGGDDRTIDAAIASSYAMVVSGIVAASAALLAFLVVRGIDRRQEDKHETLNPRGNSFGALGA